MDVAHAVEEQDSDACHISMAPLPAQTPSYGATSTELPTGENTRLNFNPQPMQPKLTLAKKKIPDANQDPDNVFSLCKRLQPPHKSETVPLSTPSTNLVAAEEGRACMSIDNLLPCSLTMTIMLNTNPQQCTAVPTAMGHPTGSGAPAVGM
ncbi:hypothetical protein BDN67DRAFT_985110 [Paxillus ammoniavirescens]|nr:hypothetical protein BDN67DRAFT_985110 [Paxillus ammoniavirescens]